MPTRTETYTELCRLDAFADVGIRRPRQLDAAMEEVRRHREFESAALEYLRQPEAAALKMERKERVL